MATAPSESKPSRNKWLAAILNFFGPGLGYWYVGRGKRMGLVVGLVITGIIYGVGTGTWPAGGTVLQLRGGESLVKLIEVLSGLVAGIVFAWDAYRDAAELSGGA